MATYGLSTGLLSELPGEQVIQMVADAGFRAVELGMSEEKWTGNPAGVRRSWQARGIKVRSVHASRASWDMAAVEAADRRAAIEDLCGSFAPALALGTDLVVCHCNAPKNPFTVEDYRPSIERSKASLAIAAAEARRFGVRLAVETMVSRGQKRPGNRVCEILEMIDSLGEHVGVCLDAGHSNTGGNDVAAEALAAGEKLFAVHLQDNHGMHDQDEHLLPGRGTVGWDAFLDALDRMDFTGPRTIEIALDGCEGPLDRKMAQLSDLRERWEARGKATDAEKPAPSP